MAAPLATLADARIIMLALSASRQRNEIWLYAGAAMLEAAIQRGGMPAAASQLRRALEAEGLI